MSHIKNKKMGLMVMMISLIFLAGCSNELEEASEQYMADMENIHELDEAFTEETNALDFEYLPNELSSRNEEVDTERLASNSRHLEENILPLADQMALEIEDVEVDNEELSELHGSFSESIELKQDFAHQLDDYVESYLMSVQSNEQLIQLSQSFMENQEERDEVIESADSSEAVEEIDDLIEQINENSEALDEESVLLQGDETLDEKQKHIDEVIAPLIDGQIQTLNRMNLETEGGIRVRSLTLELYYGFGKYYQERKNTMTYSERLQGLQLQNILPMKETYEKLDANYYNRLNEIESELE